MRRSGLARQLIPGSAGRLAIRCLVRLQPQRERWLLRAGRHFATPDPIRFRTLAGFTMELDLRDKIERRIYYTGMYEHVVDTILRTALPRSRSFVDMGANCGYVSLLAATMFGGRGRVYAFEPFPATYRRLERNLKLNPHLEGIVPHPVAVTDTTGKLNLYGRSGNLGSTSMAAASDTPDAVEVNCDRLDNLASALDLDQAFVKIDVEGAELRALHGMRELLARRAFSGILVEMHPAQIRELGGEPEDVPRLLQDAGYRLLVCSSAALVPFDDRLFFASDLGHRFILATLEEDWTGLRIPLGF
jgi:FkbM family methyltransferase